MNGGDQSIYAQRQLRICSPQVGLDPDAHLGGNVYDREQLRGLAELGAEIQILLPAGERCDECWGWKIFRTSRHRHNYYEYNWIFWRALRKNWNFVASDLLRVHSPYLVGLGALLFSRKTPVPVVAHFHHIEPQSVMTWIDRFTLSRYDHVITDSENSRWGLLGEYGLDPEKVTVVNPAVSDKYSPGAARGNSQLRARDVPLLLHVGALIQRKNLLLAIRALAILHKEGTTARLVLVGSGPEEGRLREEAALLEVGEQVEFRGSVDTEKKLEVLRKADIFVFPSRLEGFGFALVEAMACELPVVGVRSSSIPEIVKDGITGILTRDPDDAYEFANAVGSLLKDPARRKTLGRAARNEVRSRFSWQAHARKVLKVYLSVVSKCQES